MSSQGAAAGPRSIPTGATGCFGPTGTSQVAAGYPFSTISVRDGSDWINYKKQSRIFKDENLVFSKDPWFVRGNEFRLEYLNGQNKCVPCQANGFDGGANLTLPQVKSMLANTSATLKNSQVDIDTVTVAWSPFPGAKSYKVFFVFGGKKSLYIPPPKTGDPSTLVNSTTGLLYSANTPAVTGLFASYTVPGNNTRVTAYIYAYADIGGSVRLTDFPFTQTAFISSLIMGGPTGNILIERTKYSNDGGTTYRYTDTNDVVLLDGANNDIGRVLSSKPI
jgi:hypothetical protein